jgi:tellurite resistance protein
MGLTGLAIAFSKFAQLSWLPDYLFLGTLYLVSALFVLVVVLYGIKAVKYFDEVLADFRHRIKVSFFSTISISLLLLSVAYHPVNHGLSQVLWWTGTVLHTYLMLHTIAFWIQHNFEINHFNPAWFIPVVGNLIVPIMGVEYMPGTFTFFYFAVGAFFWFILFTIFLNRVIFHHQMPEKFIPTLFILIAPPAVGLIAYFRLTGSWDMLSEFFISITYFFVLLLLFLVKSFRNLRFFISWWAFTFPLDALTIASVVAYQATKNPFYMYASWFSLGLALSFILVVGYRTVMKIRAHEICVKEE